MSNTVASVETVPKGEKKLRACKSCSLVKTESQFLADGCDNCEEFLHLKHSDIDQLNEYTSVAFDGIVCMMNKNDSWVCKWQHIEQFVPGCYAVSVSGRLPSSIVREMKASGMPYVNRDRTLRT